MGKIRQKIIAYLRAENIQSHIKYRTILLVAAGFLGVYLAPHIYYVTDNLGLKNDILQNSLTILTLGLPTFFTLWLFRTHDVQRQIDKTQENTNNSSFFECARMLTTKDPLSIKIALEQLAYLRNETEFDKKRIDHLTQNLNLSELELGGARLNNLDFSKAIFDATILNFAKLKGTKLNETICDAISLGAAVYSQTTKFPKGFNPEEEGMIYEPE